VFIIRDNDDAPTLRGGPMMMRVIPTMMCIIRIVAAHHRRPAPANLSRTG
jgi:hypothetical protein